MSLEDTRARYCRPDVERRRGPRRHEDRRLQERERELEATRRITEALGDHLIVDDLVVQSLHTILQVVEAEGGAILLADPESERLVVHHFIGPQPVAPGTAISWDQGVAGEVFQSHLPIIIHDAAPDVRYYKSIDGVMAAASQDLMAFPLKRWEGEPIGVLEVVNKRTGLFDQDDLSLVSLMSALTAIAIERARRLEKAKSAELARLAGDIGHDIKNMLMPIICGTGLLESEVHDLLRSEWIPRHRAQVVSGLSCEVTMMVRHSTRRIQDRMKDIVDCVNGGSTSLKFAPCKIGHIVKAVYETLSWTADEKKVALRTEGLDQLPSLLADEHRLFNAFYNLVSNAIPEVPPWGSVTVAGHVAPPGEAILIEVRDTGQGMAPEVRDSLFTPRVRSRKPGGTGLGTKLVKDVVDAHGGAISVTSESGVGTTFLIRLPLQPPQSGRAAG